MSAIVKGNKTLCMNVSVVLSAMPYRQNIAGYLFDEAWWYTAFSFYARSDQLYSYTHINLIFISSFYFFTDFVFIKCAGHGTGPDGESPFTGIYRQV